MRPWLAPTLAVLVGIALGAGAMMHLDSVRTTNTATAPPPENPANLNLKVNRDGPALKLSWNTRESTEGVLEITDGNHQIKLKLDPSEIRSGRATYEPDSDTVSFRLTLADGRTEGTQVGGLPLAEPPTPAPPKPPVRRSPRKARPRTEMASRSAEPSESMHASKPSRWNRLVHKVFRR